MNTAQGPEIRNLIAAMGLSVLVLLGWDYFYAGPEREAALQEQAQQQAVKSALAAPELSGDDLPTQAQVNEFAEPTRQEQLSAAPRLPIRTNAVQGSINLRGLRLDDLTLSQYRQTTDANSDPVTLLSPAGHDASYFAEFGWLSRQTGLKLPDANSEWRTNARELVAGKPIMAFWENGQGLRFERTITLDEHYMFSIQQRVINQSASEVTLYPYGRISRNFADEGEHFFILHEGPLGVFDEALAEVSYGDLRDEERVEYKKTKGWIGITDKYWLSALVPDANLRMNAKMKYMNANGRDGYQVDYTAGGQTLKVGEELLLTQRLFAGAKQVSLLDDYMQRYNIALFDRAVDFGWFYFLTKPIFHALDYFNAMLGNFGLAIMLLTVCIKLLLFPLANKSYKAMSQMKVLMPKITDIKERHKDDKMAMNQAIMKLYSEEKVNPASGCLPMLVQIPIFFSLYKVLFVTLEMRHADFYGWVSDLSAPDPTSLLNLFGLLPYDAPSFLMVGAWPCIMCATMVIQMRLNPKPQDPAQAMVMQFMPYMFLFLFASFPAGLVIYWAWNNSLSILQQWVIMRKHAR